MTTIADATGSRGDADRPLVRRNIAWSVTSSVTGAMGAFLVTANIFQAFLLEVGVSKTQLGTVGSAMAVAGAASMFSLMGLANGVHRRLRVVTVAKLAICIVPLALVPAREAIFSAWFMAAANMMLPH